MPTKKRRVGFIPRSDVFEIINKLSLESNLSNSKIINILVEEALAKRGLFDIKTGKVYNDKINRFDVNNLYDKDIYDYSLDSGIYKKFIMFLQFQEKIRNGSLE